MSDNKKLCFKSVTLKSKTPQSEHVALSKALPREKRTELRHPLVVKVKIKIHEIYYTYESENISVRGIKLKSDPKIDEILQSFISLNSLLAFELSYVSSKKSYSFIVNGIGDVKNVLTIKIKESSQPKIDRFLAEVIGS